MEEHNSSLSPQESAAALSARALREMQQRAQTALAASRAQAARLEAEITQQLDAIAATLHEQTALDSQSTADADGFQSEVARLTEELERSRAAWLAERTGLEAQHADLAQKLGSAESLREELARKLSSAESAQNNLVQKLTEVEIEREILAQKVAKLAAQSDDISPKLSSLETLREDLSQQITSLETAKGSLSKKVTDLEAQREDLSQRLNTAESEKAGLSEKLTVLKTERDELCQKASDLESQCDGLAAKAARLETERDDLTQIASNYEVQRDGLSKQVAALESERDERAQTAAALEAQIHASQAEWRNQLLDFENRLRDQQSSWTEQRSEWTQTRADLERERDELQQKFDLALQDLQRLRARGAELEQDLARRPEPNQADSAELVALRAERDDLAARVEQLEQRPTAPIDPNVEQQLSDLQRRFELAVEDLRDYKTKCGKLESQLAAAGSQSRTAIPDTGGNDWESQKRRLLASLEESADAPETPVEKQQRITIEGTIEMTDAVVAEKDRQIADLQAQLASAGDVPLVDHEHARKVNDLVEADEVIAEHRQRVRELEREMQEKLRTAELELSVERAKMARQKAELDQLKSDLDSKQQDFDANGGASTPGQPKRRWRDKLGLSGDE